MYSYSPLGGGNFENIHTIIILTSETQLKHRSKKVEKRRRTLIKSEFR